MILNEKTRRTVFMVVLTAALTMALLPLQVWAEAPMDGIPKDVTSINLPPECEAESNCTKYNIIVEPDKGDVFVIAAVKNDPDPDAVAFNEIDKPFELLETNMKVNLHLIDETDTDNQKVYGDQYAVKVYDDKNINVDALGMTQIGTPVYRLSGNVYTNRIVEEVRNACPGDIDTCTSIIEDQNISKLGEEGIKAVADFYIKNVLAHETFHMLGRAPYLRKYGNHTPQLGLIMDHHMSYKAARNTNTVTWDISDKWLHETDQSGELIGDIPAF